MGSFLNATAGRWGSSRQNARRSKCFTCGEVLTWKDLFPIVSWVKNGGRCTSCYSAVSIRYPLVELVTSGLFVGIGLISQSYTQLVFLLVVACLMSLAALIDFDQFIIPHEISIPLALLSLASVFISPIDLSFIGPSMWQILSGPILASFFWGLWIITRGKGMGFADGTLSLSIGWLLGLSLGVASIVVSFWVGSIISVGLLLLQRQSAKNKSSENKPIDMKTAVPFGPYLVLGYFLTIFFQFNPLQGFTTLL